MTEAYCVKCKKKIEIKNPEETVTAKGVKAMTGNCPDCNTKVFRMMGK